MSNVLIIPGSFGTPYENWIPWLFSKLNESGIEVRTISMPTPEGQDFDHWSTIMDVYCEVGILDCDSIVVAHSAASAFYVKYMGSSSRYPSSFISVAGYNNFYSGDDYMDNLNSSFYFSEVDHAILDKVRTVSFFSPSDPYIPISVSRDFARSLRAACYEIDGAGHFNSDSGYTEFGELLSVIKGLISVQ